MTSFCDAFGNSPAAIIVAALFTGIFMVPLTESDDHSYTWGMVKELILFLSAALLFTLILKKNGPGLKKKAPSKFIKEQNKFLYEDGMTSQAQFHPQSSSSRQRRVADGKTSVAPSTEKPMRTQPCQEFRQPSKHPLQEKAVPAPQYQEFAQPSKHPVPPLTFTAKHFDDQADELSQQLLPTEKCQKVVQDIVQDVKDAILQSLPYADVVGFASGEVSRGTAYGVAVPEIDIVVNLAPHILVRTLQSNTSKPIPSGKVDDRKLHKSAIRMCTDLLVSSGGFKFRRSAFRVRDPKVTLMAPRSLDGLGNIPIDFSVNAATPLCNSVLIAASGRVDPRAQMLILMVKRWAKDRGICHAAKGHLMPYCWSLLTIYFLQVGVKDGSMLPPFKHLRLAPEQETTEIAGLAQCMQGWDAPAPGSPLAKKRLGQLFEEFIQFYSKEVNWRFEVVSIRSGQRAAPHRSFKAHIIETAAGAVMAPSIEDPFMPGENLSEMLTANGLHRLGEELTRAQTCFESGATLAEIFDKYVPPEQKVQPDDSDEEAEVGKGAPAVLPTPTALTNIPPKPKMTPIAPWKKSAPVVGGAKSAPVVGGNPLKTKSAPVVAKQPIMQPPGVWTVNGQQPMARAKPVTTGTTAWAPHV